MEYRTNKGKIYGVAAPNECYCLIPSTGQIKMEKIARKIDAILNFRHITKEEYEDAYVTCLKIKKSIK